MAFQSTLPARGATKKRAVLQGKRCHFNPRSPHGERPPQARRRGRHDTISIHAPRTGSDARKELFEQHMMISIHAPRTGSDRHGTPRLTRAGSDFNPRSPHGERPPSAAGFSGWGYFNPRSPHGERQHLPIRSVPLAGISIHAPRTGSDLAQGYQINPATIFQSTLPARGATRAASRRQSGQQFQSTLPARGATSSTRRTCANTGFQSTLPARGATSRSP